MSSKEKETPAAASDGVGVILRKAWDVFSNNMNTVGPIVLLMTLPNIVFELVGGSAIGSDNFDALNNPFSDVLVDFDGDDINLGLFLGAALLTFVISVVVGVMSFVAAHQLAKGEKDLSLGGLWEVGRSKLLTLIIAGFLSTVLVLLGLIVLILPGLIIAALLSFAGAVIIDREDVSAVDSLKESKRLFMSKPALPITWFLASIGISILLSIVNAPLTALTNELGIVGSTLQGVLSNAVSVFLLIGFMFVYFALKGKAGSSAKEDVYSS